MKTYLRSGLAVLLGTFLAAQGWAAEFSPQGILKQALLGAGSGALSAELSGGKAGTGALVGAGTSVIGGALFGALFDQPSSSGPVSYAPSYSYAPQPAQPSYYSQPIYAAQQPQEVVYTQPSYSYGSAPQTDTNRTIIRQGLLGAGVGAFSAGASGGKAGTGALIGAGTNIIGGALLDTLMAPSQTQRPTYYSSPSSARYSPQSSQKRIVRHYDEAGKIVSEEEYFI